MTLKYDLNKVMLVGRTFEEYRAMFNLNEFDLKKKIFNAASGVSSFAAEAKECNIVNGDIIYNNDYCNLAEKCRSDYDVIEKEVEKKAEMFDFSFYEGIEGHLLVRKNAYTKFLEDYKSGSDKYVFTELPYTSFHSNTFDLCLVSHLLFIYDNMLDYGFHEDTIEELLRISEEVRIFPLVNLSGERSVFVKKIIMSSKFNNFNFNIKKVNYSVFKSADEYLQIKVK